MSTKKWFTLLFVAIVVSYTLEASSKPVEKIQPDTGQRFRIYQSLVFSHPIGNEVFLGRAVRNRFEAWLHSRWKGQRLRPGPGDDTDRGTQALRHSIPENRGRITEAV